MQKRYSRDSYKTVTYVKIIGYRCCNPDCNFGLNITGHHIIPVARGGEDTYENIIALCGRCHQIKGLHSNWENFRTTLYTWKFYTEMVVLGVTSDCNDKEFLLKVAEAKAEAKIN